MKYKYPLMFLVGVVLIIAGLWFIFKKPVLHEGLVDTSLVVLGGLGVSGGVTSVYYADAGLTTTPNWQASTGSTYKQISGSYGYMIAVNTNNGVFLGTQFNMTGSGSAFTYRWSQIANNIKYVSFDFPMLVGINTSGAIVYIDNVLSSTDIVQPVNAAGDQSSKTFLNVSSSLGNAYAVGTDNKIWYSNNIRNPTWIDVTGGSGMTIGTPLQVVYDGNIVVAIDTSSNVYYSSSIGYTTSWNLLNSKKIKQISVENGIATGIGLDNRLYFAPSIKDNSWISIGTGSIAMAQVEVFYRAGTNIRTQRNTASSNICATDGHTEMGVDGLCYKPCPSGYNSNLGSCSGLPKTRTRTPARAVPPSIASCGSGYNVIINGTQTCVPIVPLSIAATTTPPTPLSEVYVITGSFSQEMAEAKCKTYGGTLATSDQVLAASTAGASWTAQGWIRSTITGATTGLVQAPTGSASVTSITINLLDRSGALCYGVKPVKGQFTNVLPFKAAGLLTSEQWNKAPICPNGYNVNVPTTCYKSCNPDSYSELDGMCIGKSIPKTSTKAAGTAQWMCPDTYTYDIASTSCYGICSPNYIASGPFCVPITNARVVVTPAMRTVNSRAAIAGTPCDSTEDLIDNKCVMRCVIGEVTIDSPTGRRCKQACGPEQVDNGDNTCSSVCPSGMTATDKKTCTFNGPKTTRNVTPRIWQAECPSGMTKGLDDMCYTNGCVGLTIPGTSVKTIDSDAMTDNIKYCNFNDLQRTPSVASYKTASGIVPCDTTTNEYVQSTYECVSLCASGETTSDTQCTPTTILRTGISVTVNCNKNEEAINGICVSKCPAGTFASGDLCVSNRTVVPIKPGITACVSTPYGRYKKWLCDQKTDKCTGACEAAKLLKDPDSNTTFVDPNDQVCISDDPTTKMYYCQKGSEAKLDAADTNTSRTDYSNTCDHLTKNYTDLSGSLNTLATVQSDLTYGRTTIGSARDALQSVYNNLNCATSQDNKTICDKVIAGKNDITSNYTSVDAALTSAMSPIQQALDSRNVLRNQLYEFRCANYDTPP